MRTSFNAYRQNLLQLLENDSSPLTVQQIFERLPQPGDLSTLYRGIKYLEKAGLIASFTTQCVEEESARFYYPAGNHHQHYIHCEKCHGFTRMDGCFLSGFEHDLERQYGCSITGHFLLLTGVCARCRQSTAPL